MYKTVGKRRCFLANFISLYYITNYPLQVFHLDENLGDDYEEESSSAGYHTDESCSPTPEPVVTGSNCEVLSVEENCSDLTSANVTVGQLAERYGALYAQANLHTLDALDALESLKDAPDLKAKILYSVVVVSAVLNSNVNIYSGKVLLPSLNCQLNNLNLDLKSRNLFLFNKVLILILIKNI